MSRTTSGVPTTTTQVPSENLTRDRTITVNAAIPVAVAWSITFLIRFGALEPKLFFVIPAPVKANPTNTASA